MSDGDLNQHINITNVATIKEVSRKQVFNQIIPDSRAFGRRLYRSGDGNLLNQVSGEWHRN